MIFQNLTMAGFKSFAEKVEMDIDPSELSNDQT